MNPSQPTHLPDPKTELGLAELASSADALLARRRGGQGPTDGRVRAAPDTRTIRYYQSLGLVDRPLRYEGRRAVYGYRHLLQAVAVKLLQAEGLSLAQVQTALQGAPTSRLETAVRQALTPETDRTASETSDAPPPPRVAPSAPTTPLEQTIPRPTPTPRDPTGRIPGSDVPTGPRRRRSGRERPMVADLRAARDTVLPSSPPSPPSARDLLAFELAPGIHLTLDPRRAGLDEADARHVAASLAAALADARSDDVHHHAPPPNETDPDEGSPSA